jgi:type IX secretion system PorP/SprF family membrane protein
MKKILYIIIIVLPALALKLRAQQLPTFTEYFFDKAIINPAFVGTQPNFSSTLAYRSMFNGVEGAPVTQFLSVHGPWQSKNIGLGLNAVNDIAGPINTTKFNGMFSYYLGLGKGRLSLGVSLGVINYALNFSNLIRTDAIDAALSNNKLSKISPDASFGIFYQTKNYFLGYSAMQLIRSKLDLTNQKKPVIAQLYTHNFITGGLNLGFNEKLRFEPSFLIKTVSASPVQYDLNLRALALNTIGLGLSLRSGESICSMLDVLIKEEFRLGLAYDKTISGLSTYSKGSVEIMLSYRKKLLPPARQREMHPRYYVY